MGRRAHEENTLVASGNSKSEIMEGRHRGAGERRSRERGEGKARVKHIGVVKWGPGAKRREEHCQQGVKKLPYSVLWYAYSARREAAAPTPFPEEETENKKEEKKERKGKKKKD